MSDKHITEPQRETPVVAEVDVVVVGAGPAGLPAAIAAARTGADVLLIEKHGFLGGMMTAGGVQNIRKFNDGKNQVIGGIGAELVERIRDTGGTEHTPTNYTCIRQDPEITKMVAQEMVLESGVKVLLHTMLVGAIVENGVVMGVLVENKSGRGAVLAKAVVDATGDGDVICRSGAEYEKSDGELQPMSLTFVIGGVECWDNVQPSEMKQAVAKALEDGTFPATRRPALFPMWREGFVYANATRIPADGTDAWALTEAEFEGRRQVTGLLEWLRENAPGYENAFLVSTAPQVGLRETRRLVGLYTLTRDDVLEYRDFDDNIARAAYRIDIHYPGRGGESKYLEEGRSYGIPYRCLVPKRMDGLLAAGRCISTTHEGLGSVRVMGTGMATGHAAGVAAALSAKQNTQPRHLNISQIQQTLRDQNAIL